MDRPPTHVDRAPESQEAPVGEAPVGEAPVGKDTDPGEADATPEQTADDTDAGWGERPKESRHEAWLREQQPPHWG